MIGAILIFALVLIYTGVRLFVTSPTRAEDSGEML